MREIKFRMFFDGTSYLEDFPDHQDAGKKFMVSWGDLLSGKDDHVREYFTNQVAGCSPLMQYTSLKDKNGVEIYESDLIESDKTGLHYKVTWDDAYAKFIAYCINPKKDFCLSTYSWEGCKVIGNIYETN